MDTQTIVAVSIVLVCAAIVLRSWLAFWFHLVRSPKDEVSNSSCSHCVNGCDRNKDRVSIVELKRIAIKDE
jgi:hypothetical protein